MAITDKEKGVWGLDQVYNKINQGSIWEYSGSATEPAQLWVLGQEPGDSAGINAYSSPIQIPGDWKKYYNFYPSFGIRDDNTLWGWGSQPYGALGINSRTSYSSPIQIPGTWSVMMTGNDRDWYKQGAINTDGELFCWGQQNGANTVKFLDDVNYSSPVQIPGTTWKQGDWNGYNGYWTKTDGTMWAVGSNMYGQLGAHNGGTGGPSWATYARSSPCQIPGTSWSDVSGSLALRTDGTLWVWGSNELGLLGQNNPYFNHKSSPTQMPGTWKSISASETSRMAIKTDGTLWGWGVGSSGQLGLNDLAKRSSPTQVGTDTTWETVANFYLSAKAIKTDGTLWAWGRNQYGQLGQNSTTYYSSPVQIPGTWLSDRFETSYGGALRF